MCANGDGHRRVQLPPGISKDSQASWADTIILCEAVREQFTIANDSALHSGLPQV